MPYSFYQVMEETLAEKDGAPRKRRATRREQGIVEEVKASVPTWSQRLKEEAAHV